MIQRHISMTQIKNTSCENILGTPQGQMPEVFSDRIWMTETTEWDCQCNGPCINRTPKIVCNVPRWYPSPFLYATFRAFGTVWIPVHLSQSAQSVSDGCDIQDVWFSQKNAKVCFWKAHGLIDWRKQQFAWCCFQWIRWKTSRTTSSSSTPS